MKFIKMLGLMAVAAAAMMAFAGIASADVATSPAGTTFTGSIVAEEENNQTVSLHGSNGVTIECHSNVSGPIQVHGAGKTVEGNIAALSFPNCKNETTTHVLAPGRLIAHATGTKGDATLTSTGATVQVTTKSIFGVITCEYTTNNTDIGLLTSSTTTGGNATLDVNGLIPRTGGSALCGNSGVWTGAYTVTSPAFLEIDPS